MILKENEIEKITKAGKKTLTNYKDEMIICGDKGYIEPYTLYTIIEDLLIEINGLEEEKEDILNDRDSNWKPLSIEEQI